MGEEYTSSRVYFKLYINIWQFIITIEDVLTAISITILKEKHNIYAYKLLYEIIQNS